MVPEALGELTLKHKVGTLCGSLPFLVSITKITMATAPWNPGTHAGPQGQNAQVQQRRSPWGSPRTANTTHHSHLWPHS